MEMVEIWRDVKGYEGYEVSNFGNVRSYRKRNSKQFYETPHHIKANKTGRCGSYLHFYASNEIGRVRLLVHRVVANAFLDNLNGKPEVNHKDKNGHNNCVSNLEWVTSSENQLHAKGGSKFVPSVGLDKSNYRVYFRKHDKRTSKNFKTKKVATAFANSIYEWQDQ